LYQFCFSPSPLGGVPLCMTRRRFDGQQNVGGDAHIAPPISFPHTFSKRTGGRGRPPLQFIRAYDFQTAGRIISAPTFPHTFCKRPGRRGRRPLQFVPADVFGLAGRPRAASPTGRFQSCCPNGRADNIRPYISAHVLINGRDVEDAVPYNLFRQMFSDRLGGRGRPPLQVVSNHIVQTAGRIISAPTFPHTFCKWPGRQGRRPLQFIPKNISKPPGGRGRPPLQYLETYSRFTLALL